MSRNSLLNHLNFRKYNPKEMIEMDRFVHILSGEEIEDIRRASKDSSSTMKDNGMTLRRYNFRKVNHNITSLGCKPCCCYVGKQKL